MSKEKYEYSGYKKMVNKAINCCILVCVISCCFFYTALGAVENELEVYPGKFKKIELPYKYRSLNKEEIAQTGLILERCYTTLKANDLKKKFVIIGHLKPCVGIGLYYDHKAVLAHVHFSSDVSDFINKAKKELGINQKTDPKQISGFIYTCRTKNYSDPQLTFGFKSWRDVYEGRTQEQEVEKIKKELMQQLNITDDSQIRDTICALKYSDEEIGWFPYAEFSVLVTLSSEDGMEVYNTCMLHEEVLFSGFQEFSKKYSSSTIILPGAKMMMSDNLSSTSAMLSQKAFWEFEKQKNTYGKIPFVKMPELLSDLGCPVKIDEEQFKDMLRGCKTPKCANCFKTDVKLSVCAQCRKSNYCSRDCQVKDWSRHKEECKKKQ